MKKLKDTDLREALRRNYAETPQLPEDFMERIHEAVEQEESQPRRARRYRLAAAITSIAAAILIAFLLWPESQDTTLKQPEQPVIAEVTSPKTEPKENVGAEVPAAQTHVSARKHVAVEPKPKHAIREPEPDSEPVLAKSTPADTKPAISTSEDDLSETPARQDPFLAMNAQAQDIRSRGERLHHEIALLMNNNQ